MNEFNFDELFTDIEVDTDTTDTAIEEQIEKEEVVKQPVEEKKPAEPVETKVDPPKQPAKEEVAEQTTTNPYFDLIQFYVESGEWEDTNVEIDGEEVPITELKSIDKDVFIELKKAQDALREEKTQGKFLEKEGLDDITLKYIDIKKNGGDISDLVKIEAEQINPIKDLDINKEEVQLYLLSKAYSSQGMEQEAITTQLSIDKKNNTLLSKTKKVVDSINASFEQMVQKRQEQVAQEKQTIAEKEKDFKKQLEDYYKATNIKDKEYKKFMDKVKVGKQGVELDILKEKLNNPEILGKVLFFLEDEEGFLNTITAKKTNQTARKTIKLVQETAKKSKDLSKTDAVPSDIDGWLGEIVIK